VIGLEQFVFIKQIFNLCTINQLCGVEHVKLNSCVVEKAE
jgi:hypothetical protein